MPLDLIQPPSDLKTFSRGPLSGREMTVLKLLGDGNKNKTDCDCFGAFGRHNKNACDVNLQKTKCNKSHPCCGFGARYETFINDRFWARKIDFSTDR